MLCIAPCLRFLPLAKEVINTFKMDHGNGRILSNGPGSQGPLLKGDASSVRLLCGWRQLLVRQPPGSWKPPLKLHLKAASLLAFKFPKQNLLRELKDKAML